MARETSHLLAGGEVPVNDGLVGPAGDQSGSVGRPGGRGDGSLVSRENMDQRKRLNGSFISVASGRWTAGASPSMSMPTTQSATAITTMA
jgi:hypothetical protein